ncbi:hypothetical protein NLX86_26855 [Streptomyces sp. A3M-1-3]|uniref:hypothetical protein n=1 Tax=Streptomyces sp. A3M-1-3 TaxID=2962044 RepID=UPI0020B6E590|nr:hypothetical protein [Streptomyces sp. A3M-1-3]MCP3821579.1 hypothetical protein [Streptomyces sp. A3M-1-3]
MTVDPSDPDTFEEVLQEVLDESLGESRSESLDDEAPEADAAEQHTELRQHRDDSLTGRDRDASNDADAAEQARVVELDEDDYR